MLYFGVLVLLVLQFLRPSEWVTAIYGWPILYYTMMALVPLWILTLGQKKVLRTPEDLFAFLLWVACILSYFSVSVLRILEPFDDFGRILLCYIFVAHVIDTRRKLMGAFVMTLLMLFIVTLKATHIPERQMLYASVGSFANRNDYAACLCTMLGFGAAFLLRGRPWVKMLGALAFIVGAAEVIKTDSRGGQLAAIASVYTIICLRAKTPGGRKVMAVGAIVVLLLAFSVSERLGSITQYQQDASAMGRVQAWREAFWAFMSQPLVGVGYQKFFEKYGTFDTHSSFMRAIAELGILGLFVYVAMLFFSLRSCYNLTFSARDPTTRMAAMAMTSVLVGNIVASLTMTRLYHTLVLVQFAFASALRLIADRERTEAQALGELAPESADNAVTPGVGVWERSRRPGFLAPRLVSMKDLGIVGALSIGVWIMYRVFVMISYS